MADLPLEVYDFKPVTLDAVADVLNENLKAFYEDVSVSVVDCPDLTKSPFELPVQGFGGGACDLVDLGGVPYLLPTVDKSRVYDFRDVVAEIGSERFPEGWYLNGAGAGPFPSLNQNSELILSMKIGTDGQVEKDASKVALTSSGDEKDVVFQQLEEPRCALLANFLVSSPVPGKVLEIRLRRRTDPKTDFTKSIREALDKAFPSQPVGLGGLFIVKNAPTYTHIMRDFSETPLNSDEEVDQWLKFFEMDPPFMCQSVLYSSDPGLDLRIEHSHGWSLNPERKEGGHYHHDLAPDNVEYLGYYVVAEKLWRLDRPSPTKVQDLAEASFPY